MGGRAVARGGIVLTVALALSVVARAEPPEPVPARPAAGARPAAVASQAAVPAGPAFARSAPNRPAVTLAASTRTVEDARRIARLSGPDRVATAIAVARDAFSQADVAVLAAADRFADALVAAPLAADFDAPLLLTPGDHVPDALLELLDDLGVRRVVLLGGRASISTEVAATLRERWRVGRVAGVDRYDTAARVALLLPASDEVYLATGADFPDALAVAPLAAATLRPILLTLPERLPEVTASRLAERDPARVTVVGGAAAVSPEVLAELEGDGRTVTRLAGGSRFATALAVAEAAADAGLTPQVLWLADASGFADALAAGPAVARSGGLLLLVDGQRLGAVAVVADWLREREDALGRVVLLGGPAAIAADAPAQLEAVLAGTQLPRGGRSLFPEHRLVALYGHSSTPALGALGEQPPEEAADRAVTVAQPFEQGGKPVLPTFEFIATVATAGPGPSGLYRAPTDPAVLRRALEAIRRVRGYLVLDIQPGRSDFLTESQRYEALLAEPDVGLALDPEWRMGPDQRPGDTVGSVHASEINAVSQWLADLVARHGLPEKLLLVHQFQTRMIQERHLLEPREGLAITVQMDGFGSRAQKLDTYRHVHTDPPFFNGFKLFYDEDTNLFQPHEALAVEPVPDFFSYQ